MPFGINENKDYPGMGIMDSITFKLSHFETLIQVIARHARECGISNDLYPIETTEIVDKSTIFEKLKKAPFSGDAYVWKSYFAATGWEIPHPFQDVLNAHKQNPIKTIDIARTTSDFGKFDGFLNTLKI